MTLLKNHKKCHLIVLKTIFQVLISKQPELHFKKQFALKDMFLAFTNLYNMLKFCNNFNILVGYVE